MSGQSDAEVAQLLHDRQIDIAIDLKGHTQDGRPAILSFRPAPVAVSYLGFPGSMGAPFIDYVIADAAVLPLSQQPYYDEKIVHLPHTYQANDSCREIADATPSRGEVGLPATGFVFCCFNNSRKITAPAFDIWMRLSAMVPGSVLWLLDDNEAATANLKAAALERSIDPARPRICASHFPAGPSGASSAGGPVRWTRYLITPTPQPATPYGPGCQF